MALTLHVATVAGPSFLEKSLLIHALVSVATGNCQPRAANSALMDCLLGWFTGVLRIDEQSIVAKQDNVVSSVSGDVDDETFSWFRATGIGF